MKTEIDYQEIFNREFITWMDVITIKDEHEAANMAACDVWAESFFTYEA